MNGIGTAPLPVSDRGLLRPTGRGLIGVLPGEQAGQIHDFLSPLAGELAPQGPDDTAEARKKSSADWATWWKQNAAKADLARLSTPEHQFLGYTVISDINSNRIIELGRDRKPRWTITGVNSPVDALALSNNRVLIAEHSANLVTERDLKGNVIWRKNVNGNPHNLQRLPNGHTLIATNVQVVEVDRNGKEVFNLKDVNQLTNQFGQLTGAYKTRKGQYICMTQNGRCFHLDAAGKQLKFFDTNRGNAWMDLLPNGRILLSQNGGNMISEYDTDGKLHLQLDVPNVSMATGLPNGNFLVCCNQGGRVIEMNRKGVVVWEYRSQSPFRARGR